MLNFQERIGRMGTPDIIFKRVYRWTVETKNIPEFFLKISSAGDLAFDDFQIGMSIKVDEIETTIDTFKELNPWTTKLYDGCGSLLEEWEINPKEIYDIETDTHPDDPYGWVEFNMK